MIRPERCKHDQIAGICHQCERDELTEKLRQRDEEIALVKAGAKLNELCLNAEIDRLNVACNKEFASVIALTEEIEGLKRDKQQLLDYIEFQKRKTK